MKSTIISILLLFMLIDCTKYKQDTSTTSCGIQNNFATTWPFKDTVQKLMQQYAGMNVPGLVFAVYTPTHGYWGTSTGYAKIENRVPMQLCHLQYLQSASKMYMAAAILRLHEEGKIDLDAPLTNYLSEEYSHYIDKASTIHVRNLLNHTSGMPDYLDNPAYIMYVLQHPDHYFTSHEILNYINNKKQRFTPGSKFEYSNTNFHVLALIADVITGDHNKFIREKILAPLALRETYYREITGQPFLVNSYLDRFSDGIIENVSQLQQVSISFSKGDDGIIATPFDAINFLRGLMEGKLLTDSSLAQMMTFVKNKEGNPEYGLGLYYVNYGGQHGYGHGGSGAGAGCALYYFPVKKTYVFLGTNIGTLVNSPGAQKVLDLKNKLLQTILEN